MEALGQKQHNHYARMMNRYDDLITGRKWWSNLYMKLIWKMNNLQIANEVMQFIPNNFSGTLLDVPIGTAIFTYQKYKKLKDAEIVGLDYSSEMLRLASIRAKEQNIKNLKLIEGDVGSMPFEDNSFDLVLCMSGFQVFPDNNKALSEIYRVMAPEAHFCGCFYVKGERKIADLFAHYILDRKGLFNPPHWTLQEALTALETYFGTNVHYHLNSSILIFDCIK